jgi:SAM-dependent methyltransferase
LGGDGLFDVADQHLAVQQPPRLGRDEELKLSSPATARNREPIAAVLADWLPKQGLVLEVASGAGEHAAFFAQMFPDLDWQPSDPDPQALTSIEAWRADSGFANLRQPLILDAASASWPVDQADALLNINMAHISPWEASLGLLDGAARVLPAGGPLILYGPWLVGGIQTAPSNLTFDADLKRRNPAWGLRHVEDFAREAEARGLDLVEQRPMPANNRMLLLTRG